MKLIDRKYEKIKMFLQKKMELDNIPTSCTSSSFEGERRADINWDDSEYNDYISWEEGEMREDIKKFQKDIRTLEIEIVKKFIGPDAVEIFQYINNSAVVDTIFYLSKAIECMSKIEVNEE